MNLLTYNDRIADRQGVLHAEREAYTKRWPQSLPFYYGWVNVILASLAMTATLPGRTHGLGLITEPLLRDLNLAAVWYARINLVGALAGAAFCLPIGSLVDRYGVRIVVVAVVAALGASVLGMSAVEQPTVLLLWLILVRGLGQSALSVVSMAMIGKWFSRRLGVAMGVFAVLLTFGFIASVLAVGWGVENWGWRVAWRMLGLVLLGITPLFWLLVRSKPEACQIHPDAPGRFDTEATGDYDASLRQALKTPVFWVVVLGCSLFNLVWAGITLFNESLLAERGLDATMAVQIMAILTGTGLLANLVGGALATRERVVKLLAAGLVMLAAALAAFPTIDTTNGALLYAATIGLAGGIVTVVYFAAWGHLFGRAHLGRIQGAAQLTTVVASALGPVLMAEGRAWAGSATLTFYLLAAVAGTLALAATVIPQNGRHAPRNMV